MGGVKSLTPKLKKPTDNNLGKELKEFQKDPVAYKTKRRKSYEDKGYSILTGEKEKNKKTILGG